MFGLDKYDSILGENSFYEDPEEKTKITNTRFSEFNHEILSCDQELCKRKRIMSNIDQPHPKKIISPKRWKRVKTRKGSISDKEFFAFYSAFELHSKRKSSNIFSNETVPDDNSTGLWTFSSPQRFLNSSKDVMGPRLMKRKSLKTKKATSKIEGLKIGKRRPRKRTSMGIKDYQRGSMLSNELGSIVDALKEIGDGI